MTTVRGESATLTVDGRALSAERVMPIMAPADGSLIGYAPACTAEQLDAAFKAAHRAFPGWRRTTQNERGALLKRAAEVIEAAAGDLGRLLSRELGRVEGECVAEALIIPEHFRYFADLRLTDVVLADDDVRTVRAVRRPVGVVAALTPWNSPLSILAMKIAPALMAGNTVVLKPSPLTPLATLRVGELLRDVFPAGVLNFVSGDDALGPLMTGHPLARKVSFSGSVGVGKLIAAAAASDLKRVTLELGGNDAAVVLAGADVPAAARDMFRAAFVGCGQACVALKRVYAVAEVYDALVEELRKLADAAVVGQPNGPATQFGSLVSDQFRAHVAELVDEAGAAGARIIAGGVMPDGSGWFYPPTIVADAQDGMRLVDEEQFGPALPVVRCADADEAVRRANATMFGLGASVWSNDLDEAHRVAGQLSAGTVWINTHRRNVGSAQPISGRKWSGVSVELGPWGLEAFTELQTVFEVH